MQHEQPKAAARRFFLDFPSTKMEFPAGVVVVDHGSASDMCGICYGWFKRKNTSLPWLTAGHDRWSWSAQVIGVVPVLFSWSVL